MKAATAITTLLLVALLAWSATAQPPSCASKLTDCAPDLNATKPSDKCCASLKEAVDKELSCLCSLLQNTALINSLGINITKALELPKHCGIRSDTSVCKNVPPPGTPASPSGTPSSGTPSATPATPKPASNDGASHANSFTLVVMPLMISSLLFWWSVA